MRVWTVKSGELNCGVETDQPFAVLTVTGCLRPRDTSIISFLRPRPLEQRPGLQSGSGVRDQPDEERDDDDAWLLFSPSTNTRLAADSSRPGSRPLFVRCLTLPALILAKVLSAPLLSKYAIFWLGTSTTEQAAFPSLYSFLSSSFFRGVVCVTGAAMLIPPCDMDTCQHESRAESLNPAD